MAKRKPEVREYLIKCRLEYEAEVIVVAADESEAERKFNSADWTGEPTLLDMPNWTMQRKPVVNE